MSRLIEINRSLLYFFIFTLISSSIAYYIVISSYDGVFDLAYGADYLQ